MNHKVKISAIACRQPIKKFKNNDPIFNQLPEMSNRWWRFWGIEERGFFQSDQGETELSVAVEVVNRLLDGTQTKPSDIDMLICAASCPIMTDAGNAIPESKTRLYPRLSRILKQETGLVNALSFDSQVECASFLLNLKLASSYIRLGLAKNILVICSEYISNMLDFTARSATIFADGCAGVLLTESNDESDLLGASQHSNAEHYEIATGRWRAQENERSDGRHKLYFTLLEEGQSKMQEFVPQNVPIAANRAMKKAKVTSSDIDHFIFHQPSPFLIHAWATGVGCPEEKYTTTLEMNGVMVSVSIPFTLYTALIQNKIPSNGKIVLAGAATGWGFAAQVWQTSNITIC